MIIKTFLRTSVLAVFLLFIAGTATQAQLVLTADTTSPSSPTNLTAINIQATRVTLNWIASTNDVIVTNYLVKRGGVVIAFVTLIIILAVVHHMGTSSTATKYSMSKIMSDYGLLTHYTHLRNGTC